MSDEITIYELTEARVLQVRAEPGTVILAMRSGESVRHYSMAVADLKGLAERLAADAMLLRGSGKGRVS